MSLYNIQVLLSTYNGERYLSQQLDSIISQKGVNVKLLIRDDGSTDTTKNIINDYASRYDNIEILDDGENLGPGNSFFSLLYNSGSVDFYAFADQDDIWMEDKLLVGINNILNKNIPALYASNQLLYSTNGLRENRYSKNPPNKLVDIVRKNYYSGCTMVMNKQLRDILIEKHRRPSKTFSKARMHDSWFVLASMILGCFVYDSEPHIFYRIHESNYVGISKDDTEVKQTNIFKNLKNLIVSLLCHRTNNNQEMTASELCKCFGDYPLPSYLYALSKYRSSISAKISLLKNNEFYTSSGLSKFIYSLYVIFGMF